MSKVILNTFYLNPNKGDKERISNLVNYIATREGAVKSKNYNHDSTQKQEKLIYEITSVLPNVEDSALFKHYCLFPTKENASRVITEGLNQLNKQGEVIKDSSKLLNYIAERPGVLKNEVKEIDHGLFTFDGDCSSIPEEQRKMIEAGSNVYHHTISIKLDEAKYIGMDSKEEWEALVRRNTIHFAKGSNIKLEDLGFVAAVHENDVSFHVHLMQYSKSNDRNMYFSEHDLNTIRKNLTKDVYRNYIHEYGNVRDEFFKSQLSEKHLNKLPKGTLEELQKMLSEHKGRNFYGYLEPKDKIKVASILDKIFKSNDDLREKLDLYLESQLKYKGLFEKIEGKESDFKAGIYTELLNPAKNQKSTFHNQLINLLINDVESPLFEFEHLKHQPEYGEQMEGVETRNKKTHDDLMRQEYELFKETMNNQKIRNDRSKNVSLLKYEALLRDINIIAVNPSNRTLRSKLFNPTLFSDSEVRNITNTVAQYEMINASDLSRDNQYLMSKYMQANYYIKFKEQKIMNGFNMFSNVLELPKELEKDIIFLREYVYDHKSFGFDKIPVTMQNKFNHVIKEIMKCNPEVVENLNQTVLELEQLYLKNEKEYNRDNLISKVLFGTFDNNTVTQNRFMNALFSNQLFDMETNELNDQVLLFSKTKMLKDLIAPKNEKDRITWGSDNFISLQKQGYFDKVESKEEFTILLKNLKQATHLKETSLKKDKQYLYSKYINKQIKLVSSNRNLMQSQFMEYHRNDYVQDTAIIKQVQSYINSKKYGDYKACRDQLNSPYFLNKLPTEDKSKMLLKMELLLNKYESTTCEKIKGEINLRLKRIYEESHDYDKNTYQLTNQSLLHLFSSILNHKEEEAKHNNRIKKKKFKFKNKRQINR
ncbi:MAG: hypothetical protein ACK5NF_00260 [Bacilli bacterium]